jgi:hypothetical protein
VTVAPPVPAPRAAPEPAAPAAPAPPDHVPAEQVPAEQVPGGPVPGGPPPLVTGRATVGRASVRPISPPLPVPGPSAAQIAEHNQHTVRQALTRSRIAGMQLDPPDITGDFVPGLPFRLTPEQATRARVAAELHATAIGEPVTLEHLAAGARAQNASGLERLALRITPRAGFDDLVLPAGVVQQLRDIVARVRYRTRVLGDWGMRRSAGKGRGVTALFAGDSGTGKTLSAEVLAGALGLDLYVIDLATVIDKYIGETEKNLDRIFREADRVNGVLLFDEADAIFGKRSEVHDARDRYANIEVAYLLQRMERFDGIAVLTTNLRANLDDAFLRRLDALVDFPTPDEPSRLLLWERHLPASLPRSSDVDLRFLAKAFDLPGGNIRNIAVAAAFLGAADDRLISMPDLIKATAREYRKLGRLCVEAEFGPYFEIV